MQAYSEPSTYLASLSHYSRAIHAYSEPYLSRLKYIQNFDLIRHVIFHVYSGIFTKLHISRHICPHWDSDIFRIVALPVKIT